MAMTRYHSNHLYVEETLGIDMGSNPRLYDEVISAMEKYGRNKWWHSKDNAYATHMQMNEPVLILPHERFKKGVIDVVKHPVSDIELSKNNVELITEFEEKYKKLKKLF